MSAIRRLSVLPWLGPSTRWPSSAIGTERGDQFLQTGLLALIAPRRVLPRFGANVTGVNHPGTSSRQVKSACFSMTAPKAAKNHRIDGLF